MPCFFHHNGSQEMRTNCEKQAFYYTMEAAKLAPWNQNVKANCSGAMQHVPADYE